jgi:hypothetical protein
MADPFDPIWAAITTLQANVITLQGIVNSLLPVPGPTVTEMDPTSGSASGGTAVGISGSGFTDGSIVVHFGTAAAELTDLSSEIRCGVNSPAGTGTVDVTVTTVNGTSLTNSATQFTYI